MATSPADPARLRAWWWHRQGLDGSLAGESPAAVLSASGWARSVGGAGPYLGLFARCGASREAVDAAVAELEIHELPAVRGCTYVVPRCDFALALRAAQSFAEADMRTARKLGVTDAEVDQLCTAVIDALAAGPLDPEELRTATGGASRSLGDEGKKKGLATTLPLALGRLQPAGEIRRIPINGRLDQQRYRYALWRPNPLDGFRLSDGEVQTEIARRYFSWTGPATLAEFQWFSALSAKAAKEAVAPLKLQSLDDGRLIVPEAAEELAAFRVPSKPQYALTGSVDGILLLRRNLATVFDAGDFAAVDEPVDLPSHPILDRGRVIGLWEFDPSAGSIVAMTFDTADAKLGERIERTEAFVRVELGDARSFSLDSPKSRAGRIEALRAINESD